MTAFVDTRLNGVDTWDGLKSQIGLSKRQIERLQVSDPNTTEETGEPRSVAWNKTGITTADARALWGVLPHDAPTADPPTDDPPTEETPADATSRASDSAAVDTQPPKRR